MQTLFRNRLEEATNERNKIINLYNLAWLHFTVAGITSGDLDSLGLVYKGKLKNKLSALIMNSNYKWAYIETPRYEQISQNDKLEFEQITDTVFDEIQEGSNFELEKSNILDDYLIGTTAFKIKYTGDIYNPVEIEAAPIKSVYLTKLRKGKTGDVFYHLTDVTKHKLLETYGSVIESNEHYQALQETEKIELWEGIVYNHKKNNYFYAIAKDNSFEQVLYELETDYNPWIVARFESLVDSPYGIGPCVKAILEIIALKNAKKNIAEIGKHQAKPSYIGWGDPAYLLRARVNTPNSLTYFGQAPGQNKIEPFNRGENANIEFFNLNDFKDTLKEIFYINLIESLTNIDQLKNITATTTQAVITEFSRQIEPTYSLMQKELLKNIVEKVYHCCLKASKIDISRIEVLKNNPKLKIRFYNAITIAQDQDDAERANLYFADIASKLGAVAAAANMNQVEYINATKKRFRVSEKEWKGGEETEKQVEEIQQAQAQMVAEQGGGIQEQ